MNEENNIWALSGVSDAAKDKVKSIAKLKKIKMGKCVDEIILSAPIDTDNGIIYPSNLQYEANENDPKILPKIEAILGDITCQLTNISIQIYDLKNNDKVQKKPWWK